MVGLFSHTKSQLKILEIFEIRCQRRIEDTFFRDFYVHRKTSVHNTIYQIGHQDFQFLVQALEKY